MAPSSHARRSRGRAVVLALLGGLSIVSTACAADDDSNQPETTGEPPAVTQSAVTQPGVTQSVVTQSVVTQSVVTPLMTPSGAPSVSVSGPSTNERADGSGCTPPSETDLPDGRWYGRVVETDPDRLSFDLACWFTGDAAVIAAAEDGAESPPPNDYHVRNDNDLLRSLAVAGDVPVVWYPDGGDPADVVSTTYDRWRSDRARRGHQLGVWLTIDGGTVVAIDEQWVP